MEKIKFDYDDEHDSLYIYRENEKVKGSIELLDFVLDLDMNLNKINGLEIHKATETLSMLFGRKMSKTNLINIKKASLRTLQTDEGLYALFAIFYLLDKKQIKEESSSIPVPIPISSQR